MGASYIATRPVGRLGGRLPHTRTSCRYSKVRRARKGGKISYKRLRHKGSKTGGNWTREA